MFNESEHSRDKDGKFTDAKNGSEGQTAEEIAKDIFPHLRQINQDIFSSHPSSLDKRNRKGYNKSVYKKISKREYAVISSIIMRKNAKYIAQGDAPPKQGTVRSSEYFYVYENISHGVFGVLAQIKIDDTTKQLRLALEEKVRKKNGI